MAANDNIIRLCKLCHKAKANVAFLDKRTGDISWYCSICWTSVQSTLRWRDLQC